MSKKDKTTEYTRVKKSLEVLGYNEPLGLDSVILVNRLLNDLINTTDSYKKLQDEKEKLSLELKNQGNLILPLRNENLRITKENNELHNQMIQLEDNRDDFKLLLNQKELQIKNQQSEIDSLKGRLQNY